MDNVTGLQTKRYLDESLERECRRAMRYGTCFSWVMIDLDDFKQCNDRYGQRVGNDLLRRVAALISCSVRDTDIVSRYGKDEFSILLPETDYDGAMRLAERLRFDIAAQRLRARETAEPMTASIGVYSPGRMEDLYPEQIVSRGEAAVRTAKDGGRNRVLRGGGSSRRAVGRAASEGLTQEELAAAPSAIVPLGWAGVVSGVLPALENGPLLVDCG